MTPRLLDSKQAGAYLGISKWTVRRFVELGELTPVRLPSVRSRGESRRLLFDREDLDRFVNERKLR